MSDYPSQLEAANTTLQTKKNLPELFCKLFDAIESLPPETHAPETLANVQTVFHDVNAAVEQYNKQFQILIQELGVLCKQTNASSKFQTFFTSFLDLLRLAYTVYEKDPNKLSRFQPLLQTFIHLLDSNHISLKQGDIEQNALLLQLVKSAWALTNTRQSMEHTAKELRLQRAGKRTRKQKHRN